MLGAEVGVVACRSLKNPLVPHVITTDFSVIVALGVGHEGRVLSMRYHAQTRGVHSPCDIKVCTPSDAICHRGMHDASIR